MAIVVPIVTEYNGKGLNSAVKEISKAEGGLGKLNAAGKVLGKTMAAAGVAFVAFQGAKFLVDATKSAGDLQEALSKNKVIFGDSARAIEAFSETAAANLGQTETQALNAASTFATFGKAASLSGAGLVDFSTKLTTLASDLGSFWNVGTEEAITAVGAALRNETEPIRRFGVMINQASLEQKAFDIGLTDSVKTLTQQQRTLAAYASIMEQTTDAQGDFTRTQDGLANTTKTLSAAFENAKASIGEGFLVAIQETTRAMGGAKGLAGAIETTGDNLGTYILGLGIATGAVVEFANGLGDIGAASGDASKDTDSFATSTALAAVESNAIVRAFILQTEWLYNLGTATQEATAAIDGQYDSTIALAQAQRAAAYEQSLINGTLKDSARDPSLDRLKAENHLATMIRLGIGVGRVQETTTKAYNGTTAATTKLATATDKAQAVFDKLAGKVELSAGRLEKAKDALDAAREAFTEYSAEKSAWVTGQINLGAAIDEQVSQTLRLAELDKTIAAALAAGDTEGAAKAQAEKAGEKSAVNWVDGFRGQIAASKDATDAINTLMASLNPADTLGNKALLDALTQLDPAQAKLAATDLITRGLGPEIAAELANLNVFAGAAGDAWAGNFYNEGIDAANAQVTGITTRLNERLEDLRVQGRKMGKAVKDGYDSVVNGLPAAARDAIKTGGLGANGSPVTIHVNAPVGDPIAIARVIRSTLRTAEQRTGR